jgi:hypothetical protein
MPLCQILSLSGILSNQDSVLQREREGDGRENWRRRERRRENVFGGRWSLAVVERLADLLPCGIPLSSAKRGYVRRGSHLAPQISIKSTIAEEPHGDKQGHGYIKE